MEDKLSEKEKGFIITSIMMATKEGFYNFPRYNELYEPESGIKYDNLTKAEIIDLLRKIGADEEDLEEFFCSLKFA